jgi:DNA replication protein DnaC
MGEIEERVAAASAEVRIRVAEIACRDGGDRLKAILDRVRHREKDPLFRENLADLAAEVEAFLANESRLIRRISLGHRRVPEATWARLDSPDETAALVKAKEFLAAPATGARFLTLAGPKGRGKTFALAWAVAKNGGRYFEAQELVQLSTFERLSWDDMVAAPILALDELGAEQGNASFDANLYSVLNQRFRRERKTLLATNLMAVDFRQRYLNRDGGLDRLEERLRTGGTWEPLPGPSLRSEGRP